MARLNVYVPDDVAERAREAGLNVSALTQAAIVAELDKSATNRWLADLPAPRGEITREHILGALDAARDDMGDRGAI
ncbi:type II toxin-antitoxin system CcdA family antitoxin [Saccharomonospora saliphila]|uniref:type II toxin-antitoxin system CcdA family antitoxin n=1 Tax=Saccharomonospora saliphila TaxID=369829 RepID=UPI000364DF8A|nr:type II toxin-antitoxin system CcdA family antitoxin [Saccharomonospora saliphila]